MIGAGLALLAVPVVGDPVAVARLDVPVQAVVGDVELAVGEPLVERRVRVVEHLLERLRPVEQVPRAVRPEPDGVGRGLLDEGAVLVGVVLLEAGGLEALDLEQLLELLLQLVRIDRGAHAAAPRMSARPDQGRAGQMPAGIILPCRRAPPQASVATPRRHPSCAPVGVRRSDQ